MEVKPIKVSYVSEANSEMLIKFDIEALIKINNRQFYINISVFGVQGVGILIVQHGITNRNVSTF